MTDRTGDDGSAANGPETGPTLTAAVVEELADEYGRTEPFDLVEREHTETLPKAFASGEFGRRDAEWVVQWYYRRGSVPDADRRAAEARFRENDFETTVEAVQGAAAADDLDEQLDRLTGLTGVDVPVASAFLAFTHPDRYVAVGLREWEALREADELADPYPDPVDADDYRTYLDAVAAVADRVDRDRWTVYRAVWRFGAE